MMNYLNERHFIDENEAFAYIESKMWPNGPVCAHCSGMERITRVKANPAERIRTGLWRCGNCKKQFTVKVGTTLHQARVPMHKILQAIYLLMGQNNDVTPVQLQRVLEITDKSTRFLTKRIRDAFEKGDLAIFDDDTAPTTGMFSTPLFGRSLIADLVANERLIMKMFVGDPNPPTSR